jgi:hypothetical protein
MITERSSSQKIAELIKRTARVSVMSAMTARVAQSDRDPVSPM